MKKSKVFTGNPICPYTKKDCNGQDLDGYTDCKDCSNYGNGVRATGGMPGLEWLINIFKKSKK